MTTHRPDTPQQRQATAWWEGRSSILTVDHYTDAHRQERCPLCDRHEGGCECGTFDYGEGE